MIRTATVHRTNEKITVTHEVFGKLRSTLGEPEFADWVDHLNEVTQVALAMEFASVVKMLSTLETETYYPPVRAEQTLVHDGTTVIIRVELSGTNKMPFGARHNLVNIAVGDMVTHAVRHFEPEAMKDEGDSLGNLGEMLAGIILGGKLRKPFGGKPHEPFDDPFGSGLGDDLFGSLFGAPRQNGDQPRIPSWMPRGGGLG